MSDSNHGLPSIRDYFMEISCTLVTCPFEVHGLAQVLEVPHHEVTELFTQFHSLSTVMLHMLSRCLSDMHDDERVFIEKLKKAACYIGRAGALEQSISTLNDAVAYKEKVQRRANIERCIYALSQLTVDHYVNGENISKLLKMMYNPNQLDMLNYPGADPRMLMYTHLLDLTYRVSCFERVKYYIRDYFLNAQLGPLYAMMCATEKELEMLRLPPSPRPKRKGRPRRRPFSPSPLVVKKRRKESQHVCSSSTEEDEYLDNNRKKLPQEKEHAPFCLNDKFMGLDSDNKVVLVNSDDEERQKAIDNLTVILNTQDE